MLWSQTPTILSLLTPEYQTRMVQQLYHEAVDNAPQWPASYCRPEGFMRRWHTVAVNDQPHTVLVTPRLVQIMIGVADNFVTNIHIGRQFNHEAIFYDPEALVQPIRMVRNLVKQSGFEEGDPYIFIECVQTLFPREGRPTPVPPGTVIPYEVPDMYGRPWAHLWEQYFEQGMERPKETDLFEFK